MSSLLQAKVISASNRATAKTLRLRISTLLLQAKVILAANRATAKAL